MPSLISCHQGLSHGFQQQTNMTPTFISPLPVASPVHSSRSSSISSTRRLSSPLFHTGKHFQSESRLNTATTTMVLNVLVTGAGGRTGSQVFNLLACDTSKYSVTGLVRDKQRAMGANDLLKGRSDLLIEGDITVPETLLPAMKGKDSLVILTSAVPRVQPNDDPDQSPTMYYDAGGMPEQVDWIGARSQIDLAKSLNLSHVVLVGSMGSTEENNLLNKIGNGNILKFKRKAELYLQDAGIPYTIINPGGLSNEHPAQRELVVGEKDELFNIFNRAECSIPRGDVARVVVSALTSPAAKNKALDVVAKPKGQGRITLNPSGLFEEAAARL